MWHSFPEFVLPDLDLLSSARICCPRPTLHSHSLDIGSNSENIHLTLPFNSLNIHIPFFNSIPHYPILQGSSRSTELQLCTWLHLILTFIGTKYTFWGLLAAKLIEMPKSGPPETSQLCEYSEIYSVSLEMFATRGKCFKKMNTWNLTLLSFIDSSAERTSYFKCSGALQLSSALWVVLNIVSAHCQEEGCIGFSHHQQGRIDFNTVNPSLSTGKDFLIHSLSKDWWWENVRTPPKLGSYWEIHPRRPGDFEGQGDGFPPSFWCGHSVIINLSTGSGSENPPMWAGKDC